MVNSVFMLKLVLLNIVCIVNRNDVQSMDKKIIIIKLLKREYLTPDVLANMHSFGKYAQFWQICTVLANMHIVHKKSIFTQCHQSNFSTNFLSFSKWTSCMKRILLITFNKLYRKIKKFSLMHFTAFWPTLLTYNSPQRGRLNFVTSLGTIM